jgi:dUTPase
MLANSMGLIDATYRGVLTAAVRSVGLGKELYPVRICQVAAADLVPWKEVIVVAELPAPETVRGEGGFGSTG